MDSNYGERVDSVSYLQNPEMFLSHFPGTLVFTSSSAVFLIHSSLCLLAPFVAALLWTCSPLHLFPVES